MGNVYYSCRRFFYWHYSANIFAHRQDANLPIEIFGHQTPILRQLAKVDMYLQKNKAINLELAIAKIDGLVIEPGQTFSYWRLIGRPTKAKGYREGLILRDGRVLSGIGGGLCQLSNSIYWTAIHTPLSIKERWRHSYDVFPDANRDQPFGSGATCSYPNIDLQLKNNTQYSFQLRLTVVDGYLRACWFSDKELDNNYLVVEKDHEIKNEWWGGYSRNNKLFRQTINLQTGEVLEEELLADNQAIMMYEPLLSNSQ